jgi:hypothetical protein
MKLEANLPDITRVCTISAAGAAFRPLVILKKLKNIPSLIGSPHLASFASFTSRWRIGDLFTMFAIDFCADGQKYNSQLITETIGCPKSPDPPILSPKISAMSNIF